jgi:hypothetical protein
VSWTGFYDEDSFVAPLRKRRAELDQALQRAPDRDAASEVLDAIDELRRFLGAIKKVDGPSETLAPIPDLFEGSLFRLRVERWDAYFLLDLSTQAYYGMLVEHPDVPVIRRLDELQPRRGKPT